MLGYHPDVVLAGRRINDGMGKFIADQTVKTMIRAGSKINGAQVNVLGITFKENVPDIRNSRVFDLIKELESFGVEVCVHDPVADPTEVHRQHRLKLLDWSALPQADAIVVAVAHEEFATKPLPELMGKVIKSGCFIDVKSLFDLGELTARGLKVWRL